MDVIDPSDGDNGIRMRRGGFLRRAAIGLGTLTVAGASGLAYRAHDQGVLQTGEGPAYSPWKSWNEELGSRRLVAAAILAPSSHNAQPWYFALRRDVIDVYADGKRGTGAIDPLQRELYTGVGAAIENLVLAARATGFEPTVVVLPSDRASHAARVELAPGPVRPSRLYHQIPRRHTNRYPYVEGREIPSRALRAMAALRDEETPDARVVWFTSRAARDRIGGLLIDATEAIIDDDGQSRSDYEWFRQDWDELQRERDGITVDASGLPSLTTALAKLLPPQSETATGESWLRATRDRHTKTASAYGMVVVRDATDHRQRLEGGRLLERIHLWSTDAGLALHHMNQLTQRVDREVQLGLEPRFGDAVAELAPSEWETLSTFRIGYATRQPGRSPRRSVDSVILA